MPDGALRGPGTPSRPFRLFVLVMPSNDTPAGVWKVTVTGRPAVVACVPLLSTTTKNWANPPGTALPPAREITLTLTPTGARPVGSPVMFPGGPAAVTDGGSWVTAVVAATPRASTEPAVVAPVASATDTARAAHARTAAANLTLLNLTNVD